ncbi:FAD-binding protein [Motilibacter deserti]|uniref:FAD-binding protein n=1 Tax=Motilibacter deserti TaxID=2714956 RepID=A0ABX0GVR0_9ACTN|nr:FAD-binding protein [Motilibacter deserti]NHC13368.1 FAD-binding protein [Motilibacter deserti]
MTRSAMNWAGNITFGAERCAAPASVAELQRLVAGAERVRALGSGHSFNRIADTNGLQIAVETLPRSVEVSGESGRPVAVVRGGVRFADLTGELEAAGYALHNLGSLPHISVAGACATGTHGSGVGNGCLATAVSALELVTATGDLVTLTRAGDPDRLAGAVVGLGAVGIVVGVTLDLQPTFSVRQYVYEGLTAGVLRERFEEVLSAAYSVSVFTDWRSDDLRQVWLKQRVDEPASAVGGAEWLGARLADGPRNPVPEMSSIHCTEQLGVPGPWHERLPHFKRGFTPSSGEELQSEYFVSRQDAVAAFDALSSIREQIAGVLQISEIRAIAADELWMSMSYGQDAVAFHFTWIKDTASVIPVVRAVEEQLEPFRARPHWGKVFETPASVVGGLYERMPDFVGLLAELDPEGKFRNAFLDEYVPRG